MQRALKEYIGYFKPILSRTSFIFPDEVIVSDLSCSLIIFLASVYDSRGTLRIPLHTPSTILKSNNFQEILSKILEKNNSHLSLELYRISNWKPIHRCFPLADLLTLGTTHGISHS